MQFGGLATLHKGKEQCVWGSYHTPQTTTATTLFFGCSAAVKKKRSISSDATDTTLKALPGRAANMKLRKLLKFTVIMGGVSAVCILGFKALGVKYLLYTLGGTVGIAVVVVSLLNMVVKRNKKQMIRPYEEVVKILMENRKKIGDRVGNYEIPPFDQTVIITKRDKGIFSHRMVLESAFGLGGSKGRATVMWRAYADTRNWNWKVTGVAVQTRRWGENKPTLISFANSPDSIDFYEVLPSGDVFKGRYNLLPKNEDGDVEIIEEELP